MIEHSKIEWTDVTVNFWEGCQKVGPGCDNCYAEDRDKRFTGGKHWGPGAPRRKVKGGLRKLQDVNALQPGSRVFCSSLSDVFDNAVDETWRTEAYDAIEAATQSRIQMLTKRVGNVEGMIPDRWKVRGWPKHVGLMITVVNQTEAERDVPLLLDLKARLGISWVGLSIEPMLGYIDLQSIHAERVPGMYVINALTGDNSDMYRPCNPVASVDWVICGGESGPNARPMHPSWAIDLHGQCQSTGTPFFFKQWGEYLHASMYNPAAGERPVVTFHGSAYVKVGKKKAGRFLPHHGLVSEFPTALA